jgi:hypothetical protein
MLSYQARRAGLIASTSIAILALSACGSSTPANQAASSSEQTSTSAPTSAPATPAPAKAKVQGAVATVTPANVVVTTKTGPITVDITPKTKFTLVSPAQLTDVTNGKCASISQPAAAPGAPPAPAKTVTLSAPSADNKCPQSSGSSVRGTVTAANPQTVTVATDAGAPTPVPVDAKTKYLSQAVSTALVLAPGACVSAAGDPPAPGAAVQASAVTVSPPGKAGCAGVKP